MVLRDEVDPLTGLDSYDSDSLFHLALEADRNGNGALAQKLYERLLKEFGESRLASGAHFNLGLLFEARQDWESAAKQYLEVAILEVPTGKAKQNTWLDAHFRLAVCAGELNQWWRAKTAFDYVLEQPWLDDNQRLEAWVGKGIALHEVGDPIGAEVTFSKALRFYREAGPRALFNDRGLAAEAAFRMGEIARERYDAVELTFPREILMPRLEEKCEHLLSSQSRYFRAIRYGDAHTVAAAGLRIGSLYESLYDTIVALEAPPDLSEEQVEVYDEEVRKRVFVLVRKALTAYEKSLEIGRRAPTAGKWVARLEAAVVRLKGLWLSHPGDQTGDQKELP